MSKKKHYSEKQKKILIAVIAAVVVVLTALAVLIYRSATQTEPVEVEYTQFVDMAEGGQIAKAAINFGSPTFVFYDKNGTAYTTDNPYTDDFKLRLLEWHIEVVELTQSIWASILLMLAEYALLIGLMMFFMRRLLPKTGNFDSIKHIPKITFDDVAGEQELKKDLANIIEYLRDPTPFKEIGARMPRGLILYGPPGTGKTLTARALAGTAGVPFFSATGSDFIEMYVGLGAKRVRTLFKEARKVAPCVIFIDEIDAVGKRSSGLGSNSENNQTINALLNEMDGFTDASGILVVAATNRLEDLDPALVRPGRFDKQLAVPLPDKEARKAIIEIHKRGKKFGDDIDWDSLLSSTIGFSGADLSSMLNEAAFIAAGNRRTEICNDDIERAMYKLIMKGDKKEDNSKRVSHDTEVCAFHEAGHALATHLLTQDEVSQVTIVSGTSGAGGVTFRVPRETLLPTITDMKNRIAICYAGRAAEEICCGKDNITVGAASDIRQATEIIHDMIFRYGMSEHGLIAPDIIDRRNESVMSTAEEIASAEYNRVYMILLRYEDELREIAGRLLEKETLRGAELRAIFESYD